MQLPLHWSENELIRKTRQLVREARLAAGYTKGKVPSLSRYPITAKPQGADVYKKMLAARQLKQEGLKNAEIYERLYDVVNWGKTGHKNAYVRRERLQNIGVTIKRARDGAETLIDNAALGRFPITK